MGWGDLQDRHEGDRRQVFGQYAHYYDALYKEKDYRGEAKFVLNLLNNEQEENLETLLDVGCGTGHHLLHFAEAGLKVTGIDISETMIKQAEERIRTIRRETVGAEVDLPELRVQDIRFLKAEITYDSCVSMFAVIGYLNSNEDLARALANIRQSLRQDGLFIFDVWFGPAVLAVKPETRIREFQIGGSRIIRLAVPHLDCLNNTVTVAYTVFHIQGDRVVDEIHERHKMRFFFVPELQLILEHAGLKLVKVCPFMDAGREPTIEDWNITVVARAV